MTLNQRPTQTSTFWQSTFKVTDDAVEALYNLFLENGEPRSIDELGLFFVQQELEAEQQSLRADLAQGEIYRPDSSYAVGDKLIFSRFDYALGTVVATRPGFHPTHGDFTVLDVEFSGSRTISASFAADLQTPHVLAATGGQSIDGEDEASAAQKIYEQFGHIIRPKIERVLGSNEDFVHFNGDWFLTDLLADVQEGLLNIVDAAIDINGGPLNVDILIEQLEFQKNGTISEATRFSVNYRLENDVRFLNVVTFEMPMWYLNRLKPPQIVNPPHNLIVSGDLSFDVDQLSPDLRALLNEIDDENTPPEYARPVDPQAEAVSFVLNYPHRRSGTLPALPALRNLLPKANGRVLALEFVDGQTGDPIVGWYVSEHKYIFGFEAWFKKHELPVGAFITLKKTADPLKFVINYVPQRAQREWVRVVMVKNNQLAFEMRNRQLACRYDELMVLGEEGSEKIDELWEKFAQNKTPLSVLIDRIFPELLKLTSQGAVHINTLYSAINVARRCPPGPLLQELTNNPACIWMGHGYWTYRPSK